jgi:hypothetical protein
MRVLLVLPLMNQIRHFESVVLALAEAGHTLEVATPGRRNEWPLPDRLAAHPRISHIICPASREDEWKHAAIDFRLMVDAAHYLEAPFLPADKLRERACREFAEVLSNGEKRHLSARCPSCNTKLVDDRLTPMIPSVGAGGAARLKDLARLIEQAIPSDAGREKFLRSRRPDIVLVSPLIFLASDQADWVKSARALDIPVGYPVFSWDNLTTKGIVHVQPDRVFVWNDIQKREAIEYHGVPEDRIVVTGAPRFDAFFAMKPSMDRARFCERHRLDPAAPILTYLCSSDFVAGHEVEFIERWIAEIRREPALAACNVVVRPHPRSLHQWRKVEVSGWGRVGLSVSRRLNADQSLYDTLFHCEAVIGLNTSAQIEAGILGKPVFTLLAPGFERGQQGTLHFKYLLREGGGFVEVAKDFDEHCRHLVDAIEGRYDREHIRRFLEAFIRPAGWDRPATPILADAILQLAPPGQSIVRRLLRVTR